MARIGCRIINGLQVNLEEKGGMVFLKEPPAHGDYQITGDAKTTKLGNQDTHTFLGAQPTTGAYGETTIDDKLWDAIVEKYATSEFMQRKMVFKLRG